MVGGWWRRCPCATRATRGVDSPRARTYRGGTLPEVQLAHVTVHQPVRVRLPLSLCLLAPAAAALLALPAPGRAQLPPAPFDAAPTAGCVARAAAAAPARSGHAVLDCAGRAAQACIARPGQDNTLGMLACLDAERRYWDDRLNAAYARRLAGAREQDAAVASSRATVAEVEATLRAMQRAWISYRDAACRHEQAQWQGGSGGGPATMACQLHETARQALRLEGWWSQ
jgi:uncharacterized protein YecT (DUF1311 family)